MESKAPSLPPRYELRELAWSEFQPLWMPLVESLFNEPNLFFQLHDFLSDDQKALKSSLHGNLKSRLEINLGVFHKGKMVAWSCGYQESADTFYMMNSAVLPEHRRLGLYTILGKEIVDQALRAGFLRIYSNHIVSNNPILIAKLKLGFVLVGMELSPSMGLFARLAYFATDLQRKAIDFRAGLSRPDAELKKVFQLG
jgi:GNAT superfamily N-acetyltransferase